MSPKFPLFSIFLFLTIGLFAGGGAEDPPAVEFRENAEEPVVITGAAINEVLPRQVFPKTLVRIEGSGFGDVPGPVSIGQTPITRFLGWSNTRIWFRIPEEGLPASGRLSVGDARTEFSITPAPQGAIAVKFIVDVETFTEDAAEILAANPVGVGSPGTFTPPLSLKGEWIKSGESLGNRSPGWDAGSTLPMLQDGSGGMWFVDVVFSPQNIRSFGSSPLQFGLQDGGRSGTASDFESNFAFALTKSWALADNFTTMDDFPALLLSPSDPGYDEKTFTITIQY